MEWIIYGGDRIAYHGRYIREEQYFCGKDFPRRPTRVIVHESASASEEATLAALRRRGLSVHFIIDPTGVLRQYAPLDQQMAHAGRLNARSLGVEIINPYYIEQIQPPWAQRIPASLWSHRRRGYVIPMVEQLESLVYLICWCRDALQMWGPGPPETTPPSRGHIPWVGYDPTRNAMSMREIAGLDPDLPGIWAHCYRAHADGAFPVLYSYLRIERGLATRVAIDLAIDISSMAGRWAIMEGI